MKIIRFGRRVFLLMAGLCLFLTVFSSCATNKLLENQIDVSQWKTDYPFIFVHGLEGWGDYTFYNSVYSYWGLMSGSIPNKLSNKGFTTASASLAKTGSAWDRACELYAQLSGTVVDYGVEHSTRCKHERFGADYTGKPLVEQWDSEHKVNLIAHSFGGVASRLLIELLVNGSEEEKAVTGDDISPLFTGNHRGLVNSLTTISTPHNGVSAMTIHDEGINVSNWTIKALEYSISPRKDGRVEYDCTGYDMYIDSAAELNSKLHIQDDIYYFSIPTNSSHRLLNGVYVPNRRTTERLFRDTSYLIGKYKGKTKNGYIIDEKWRENDGIVNVISAKAPFTEPSTNFDINNLQPGIWNVMQPVYMDHLAIVGGFSKKYETMHIYVPLLDMINNLEECDLD